MRSDRNFAAVAAGPVKASGVFSVFTAHPKGFGLTSASTAARLIGRRRGLPIDSEV
jgi:hypothetical protein